MGGHGPNSSGSEKLKVAETNRRLKNDSGNLLTVAGNVRLSRMSLLHKCSHLEVQYNSTYADYFGMSSHPDIQKIQIIGFFFEIRLHWQFDVRPLPFTVSAFVSTFRPRLI